MSTYSQDIGVDASWPVDATRRMNRMFRGYAQYAVMSLPPEPNTP
jgi:hypothetical protein